MMGNPSLSIFLFALFVSLCASQAPLLFPYPSSISYGSQSAAVGPNSFTISTSSSSSILQQAIKRYQTLLFPFTANVQTTTLPNLVISVSSSSENLVLGVDESYTLSVSTTANTLSAPTVWGALRGLETFSQLVTYNESTGAYAVQYLPIKISDTPRFEWRGIMIDTARHYLSVNTILRTIDAAAYNKLNTLHWHSVDAQSFPIESSTFPRLSQFGAYSPHAVYSKSDIQTIVQYGLSRGIRVVIEFDIPGHSASWGKGYPNITTLCPDWNANVNNVALNPSVPFTFEVLEGFLGEMASLFPDEYMHLGGDEVVFQCWLDNPQLVAWMKQMGFQSGPDVEQYFETKLQAIVAQNNKTMVCWQELFNNGIVLKQDTIIEVWEDAETLQEVVNGGYRGLVAFPYYLDKQIPKPGSTHYEWVDTWQDFYNSDPAAGITGNNVKNIIGGEAIMFGEQVDSVNFDSRVWPRACGVSERLWSPQDITNISQTIPRLVAFRCRMAQRGIGAGPIAPDYCPLPDSSL
jgi:hexosaminidase